MAWNITYLTTERPELLEQGLLHLCSHRMWDHTGRVRTKPLLELRQYGALHVSPVAPDRAAGFHLKAYIGGAAPYDSFAWSPEGFQGLVIAKPVGPTDRTSKLEAWLYARGWQQRLRELPATNRSGVSGVGRTWAPPEKLCKSTSCPNLLRCTMAGHFS